MDLKEYMSIKRRIVKTSSQKKCNVGCWDCPLSDKNNGIGVGCRELEWRHPEKAEEIVKQWAKEHPVKTYAQDFFEKFPNARKAKTGRPAVCREQIYNIEGTACIAGPCTECWNEPMEDDA